MGIGLSLSVSVCVSVASTSRVFFPQQRAIKTKDPQRQKVFADKQNQQLFRWILEFSNTKIVFALAMLQK